MDILQKMTEISGLMFGKVKIDYQRMLVIEDSFFCLILDVFRTLIAMNLRESYFPIFICHLRLQVLKLFNIAFNI